MVQISYKAAIDALLARNTALIALYKEGAKSLLSRPVTSLALSMADQRRELGKELAALARLQDPGAGPIELESAPAGPEAPAAGDASSLLSRMRDQESDDYELLTALSGALLPSSAELAERLAGLAEQARKRSSWAQDHLDLLGI
ncbi:MAG TPA: hypothetical protein PLB91_16355 [Spirochaetales bacterium]|nr:hypothetical protein [Spirochaetales bacterium]HRY54367.1 hypothetical protein [Spirochaetia bacterium]HRZ64055.1 hypothetical protein [Spirochaetia bacterium]